METNIKNLQKAVYRANLALQEYGLVILTWGNVSAIDRESGLIAIKPSGVRYAAMSPDQIVVVDLNGKVIAGNLNPSSDTPTHVELYKAFPKLGAVAHTHSPYATAWAQAGRDIPFYGTTHADYFYGPIPCARRLTKAEVEGEYERNTGKVIAERVLNPLDVPAVLVQSHGVFTFGKDAEEAARNALICEEVAKMAYFTENLSKDARSADPYLLEKHYKRKHGKGAYYGQKQMKSEK